SPQRGMLDLSVIISHQLKAIGILISEDISACTICSSTTKSTEYFSPKFHSYRRDANKKVQVSAIMMT
ncbi:MAG: copper oxidase (laccase) domain-containing protein, partial [Oceanospirillaceae bacterium]